MGHKVLGIIGCYGLSDQIMHLLERDRSIDDVLVVDSPEGRRFIEKTGGRSIGADVRLVDEDCHLEREEGFGVLLWLNSEDLHDRPSALQSRQDEILSWLSDKADSILFCYGLCRSSEQRIARLVRQAAKPVFFLADDGGEVVDDCFGAVLGGKRAYLEAMLGNKGALFATTGYVEAWKRKHEAMDIESLVGKVELLRALFDDLGYRRIIRLDDGVGDQAAFEEDVRTFARTFGLELEPRTCRRRVFERSYDLAKGGMGATEAVTGDAAGSASEAVKAGLSAWSLLGY